MLGFRHRHSFFYQSLSIFETQVYKDDLGRVIGNRAAQSEGESTGVDTTMLAYLCEGGYLLQGLLFFPFFLPRGSETTEQVLMVSDSGYER